MIRVSWLLGGLVVGFVFGLLARVPPVEAPEPGAVEAPAAVKPTYIASPDCPDETDLIAELEGLEAELEEARLAATVAAAQVEAEVGAPVEWPPDVPDDLQEAGLEKRLLALVGEVDGGQLLGMDCAEYPCAAVVAFNGAEPMEAYAAFGDLSDAEFDKQWGDVEWYKADDGSVELVVQRMGFPAGVLEGDELDAANRRAGFRFEDLSTSFKPDFPGLREDHRNRER